ncbi:MAG: ornithine carbamoyltransferase [Acidimicrobiales bacterium]
MTSNLSGRSLLKDTDLSKADFVSLLDLAHRLRHDKRAGKEHRHLVGRNIALIFEKTSTRTRSAFEVAAHDQGAHATYLGPGETQMGEKESVRDTARVLGRMFDGIEYRGGAQPIVEDLGTHAGVPVWNGLTDQWHPTQTLADVLTMQDHCAKPLEQLSLCYLGDARFNMANSLLVTAAQLGLDLRIAAPPSLWPAPEVRSVADHLARTSGARLEVTEDIGAAARGVDFLYTDVWVSMGEPPEAWDERIDLLMPYQVNASVLEATQNPAVKFLHCLPAFHNAETPIARRLEQRRGIRELEVTDDVFESPASVVFDQAENRLHTIKALLVATIGD